MKETRPPLDVITDDEFKRIIRRIPHKRFLDVRYRAIYFLMFYAGLKGGEIINLGYNDFKREGEKITGVSVRKGGGRLVPINEEVAEELHKYEEIYAQHYDAPIQPDIAYFRSRGIGGIGETAIRTRLRKLGNLIGVKAHPTALRHSYGVRLVAEKKSESDFAYLMGLGENHSKHLFERYKKLVPEKS